MTTDAILISTPDFSNLLFGQFRRPNLFTPISQEVISVVVNIFSIGDEFQVFDTIISLDTVLMIDHQFRRNAAVECFPYGAVGRDFTLVTFV